MLLLFFAVTCLRIECTNVTVRAIKISSKLLLLCESIISFHVNVSMFRGSLEINSLKVSEKERTRFAKKE
jgi:hypothetical protein